MPRNTFPRLSIGRLAFPFPAVVLASRAPDRTEGLEVRALPQQVLAGLFIAGAKHPGWKYSIKGPH